MCGTPPVSGFISKWFLCLGTLQSGQLVFLVVILISSLLDAIYFFPIIITAFFRRPGGTGEMKVGIKERERPIYLFMVIPLSITAIFSVIFFLFPHTFYILDLVELAVKTLF
jgi:formate hydrogenlyase subunit 3/multisubunit Na+/H+ antiporter MnhD subunit